MRYGHGSGSGKPSPVKVILGAAGHPITTRADIQATRYVPPPRQLPPLGGNMAARRAELRLLNQRSRQIQAGPKITIGRDLLNLTTGIPSMIDLVKHGHNSFNLQKSANPTDALPLVAGFAFGGPHPGRVLRATVDTGPRTNADLVRLADTGTIKGGRTHFPPRTSKQYTPRTVQVNELTQQLTKSRSRITRTVVEKPADRISQRLQQSERATQTRGVRLLTSGERATKAGGREQRLDRSRRDAAMSQHLNAIKSVKPGSAEDVANFWYAQLPKTHRNAEGLTLIRGKQAEELHYITSGKALEDLKAYEASVRAQMGSAQDAAAKFQLLAKAEEIQKLKTDLPQRAQDTAASIGGLDQLIQKPPLPNDAAINAVTTLSADRQRILTDAGRLKQDRAAGREGLVSRWVGLEPTGAEAYIGHRLPKPESFRGSNMPSGGVGRVRSPQGAGTENKLVLAKTGRLRPSLRVAAEDWHAAQVFDQANTARDFFGKLGSPYQHHIPEGHVLVNPKGRTVPPNWKSDELAQFGDGYEDIQAIREKAKEIVQGFVADDPAGFERMKLEATAAGVDWSELRIVPKRLVDRYYAQFKPSKGRGDAAKVYDGIVDAVVTSIVFARIGYIPKNLAQNVIMAVPHQGPMLLPNAVRAAQVMADPELRALLHAEVGFGQNVALGTEALSRKVIGGIAGTVGKIADDPLRISAFMHEAAAEGVISRVNPLLTERDRTSLLNLLTNPAERQRLNDIRDRSVNAMADFSRLTPDQSRIARRFLVIPGWLMAGSRYPFHFAINHPIRSALLAYVAMGEPGAPDNLQFNKPLDEYFTKGLPQFLSGIQMSDGKVLRTGSLDPVSTPWQLGQAAVQTARGKSNLHDFTHPTAIDYAQPFIAVGIDFASGGGIKSFERLVPTEKLIRGLLDPKASTSYPEDATRAGRLRREIGVIPIRVQGPAAKTDKHAEARQKLVTTFEKYNLPQSTRELLMGSFTARHNVALGKDKLKKKLGVKKLTDKQNAQVLLDVILSSPPAKPYAARLRKVWRASDNYTAKHKLIPAWEKWLGFSKLDTYNQRVNSRAEKQAELEHLSQVQVGK